MIALAVLRRYWQAAVIVSLAGVLMVACHQRDNALREEGAMRARLAELTAKTRRDSVAERATSLVATTDTIRLTKWVTRYDTVRHTLNIHDTVAVTQYVAVTDSTIHACREAVGSLTTLCQRKDTLIADLRHMLSIAQNAPAPPKRIVSVGVSGGYGATLSDGKIRTGPSVTVGLTFHPF